MAGAPEHRAAPLVALFVTVGWASVVFAVDGLLAVLIDRDPVPSGVSPYYGLAATAFAGVVVWIVCARAPLAPSPVLPALTAGAGAYLALVASGLVVGLRLATVQATSPFTLCAVGGAVVAVASTWLGMRAWRARGRRPPP